MSPLILGVICGTIKLHFIDVLRHKGEFKKKFSHKLNLPVKASCLSVGHLWASLAHHLFLCEPHTFYVLSMTAFVLWWQSWIVAAETSFVSWFTKPKIFTVLPFMKHLPTLVLVLLSGLGLGRTKITKKEKPENYKRMRFLKFCYTHYTVSFLMSKVFHFFESSQPLKWTNDQL